jgi:uncharacterized membrane protein
MPNGSGEEQRRRMALVVLLAAEVASVVYAVIELINWPHLAGFARDNVAPTKLRILLSLVPWLAAVAAIAVLGFKVRSDVARDAVRLWAYRLAPLTVAWCVPGLLSRTAFEDRPLVLLLLASAAVIAVELSSKRTFEHWRVEWRVGARAAYACVGVMVVAYVALASWGSIRLHYRLYTSLFDLGMFENLLWNTLHGVHGISANREYFGEHAEFILYPLLPIYALFPRPETLLVLQSLFLGGAAVPLYLLSKRWLGSAWQPVVLVGAFLLFPAVHGPNFYDFHFLTLSIFFVLWAAYFFVRARWFAFWPAVVLALACREDVSVGAIAIGASLAALGFRRRVGIALALLGIFWFVTVKLVWMRSIGGDAFIDYYAALVPEGQRGFRGVLFTLLSNPLFVLGVFASGDKLLLALHLLVPLAFLPVRRPRNLFLLLPGLIVVGLAAGDSALTRIHFQYVAHFVPYVFVACAATLAHLEGPRRSAALLAVVFGTVIATVHFGAALRNRYKVSFHEVSFSWSDKRAERLAALRAVAELIPADARVAASDAEGAHVARRRYINGIKEGFQGADYVLYGLTSLRWGGADQLAKALKSDEYGVVTSRGEFVLLKRGAPTAGNAEELKRLP